MLVLRVRLIPTLSLWYVVVLGCSSCGIVGLGSVTCHPARETVVNVEFISCHHGSWMRMISKGGSFWDEI